MSLALYCQRNEPESNGSPDCLLVLYHASADVCYRRPCRELIPLYHSIWDIFFGNVAIIYIQHDHNAHSNEESSNNFAGVWEACCQSSWLLSFKENVNWCRFQNFQITSGRRKSHAQAGFCVRGGNFCQCLVSAIDLTLRARVQRRSQKCGVKNDF